MTEHETFKWICDNISYKLSVKYHIHKWDNLEIWLNNEIDTPPIKIDVREIIFTQEFMEKFIKHCQFNDLCHSEINKYIETDWDKSSSLYFLLTRQVISVWIINNLNNPVSYLYKLLLWSKLKNI